MPISGAADRQVLSAGGPARFVRMQIIERTPICGTKYGVWLFELEVWDGPEPARDTRGEARAGTRACRKGQVRRRTFHPRPRQAHPRPGDLGSEAQLLATTLRASTGLDLPVDIDTSTAGAYDIELVTGDLVAEFDAAGLGGASLGGMASTTRRRVTG